MKLGLKSDITWIILLVSLQGFWTWEHFGFVAVYAGSESSHQKYLNMCFEDERRS